MISGSGIFMPGANRAGNRMVNDHKVISGRNKLGATPAFDFMLANPSLSFLHVYTVSIVYLYLVDRRYYLA